MSEVSEVMTVREWCDLHGEPYGAQVREHELRQETRWILRAPFIPIKYSRLIIQGGIEVITTIHNEAYYTE